MLKHLTISIFLMCLLFPGCSSNNQKKKPLFSEEQTAKLKDILDRNMTDKDWEELQQKFDQLEKLANQDFDIDFRRDYDKDPWVLMTVLEFSRDNPRLQEETVFMNKWMMSEMIKKNKNNEQVNEKESEKIQKEMDGFLKSFETK